MEDEYIKEKIIGVDVVKIFLKKDHNESMNHSNARNTNTTTWNQSPNVTKDYQHSVPTNRKKKWKIAGIIMVISLLLFPYYLFVDKPVDVSKKFIERTREGDFKGAEELWPKEKVEQINARKNESRMVEYHMKNFIHYEYDE